MSNRLHRAADELKDLSPSPQKDEALGALNDVRDSREHVNTPVEQLKTTSVAPSPSPRKQRRFGVLPWLTGLLAVAALATGIDAIWTSEYCSRGRSSVSCTHGLKAQLEGFATVAVGLLFAMIPVRPSIWKWLAVSSLAVLAYGLLIASILS
ncbi:hypothetical protein [Variovorax sp. EL159]|uniref:hypothetical protein n=1 Tax=Variovorax sp. EL159 TaxID=1566270 RepID=UPI00115F89C1|nr:hypothetical protein [Variovorax sp. EL159]